MKLTMLVNIFLVLVNFFCIAILVII